MSNLNHHDANDAQPTNALRGKKRRSAAVGPIRNSGLSVPPAEARVEKCPVVKANQVFLTSGASGGLRVLFF